MRATLDTDAGLAELLGLPAGSRSHEPPPPPSDSATLREAVPAGPRWAVHPVLGGRRR